MRKLENFESTNVSGGSVIGVIGYGTIGFWTGGIVGLSMGLWPAIPGCMIGAVLGAYLGTDNEPQYIIVKESDTK